MDETKRSTQTVSPFNRLTFVLKIGLFVGFLDIAVACIDAYLRFGSSPLAVFRFIASGVFGEAAFSGGVPMAMWGCIFHFFIATSWTFLYFLAYPKLPRLSKSRIASGIVFGLVIWLVMNLIVLPLSSVPPMQFDTLRALKGIVILMICVGLPASFIVSKTFRKGQTMILRDQR